MFRNFDFSGMVSIGLVSYPMTYGKGICPTVGNKSAIKQMVLS